MRSVITKILYAALLPALVAGGIAVAQSGGGNASKSQTKDQVQGPARAVLPAPPVLMGNLTYAEIHTQRDGKEVVIRVDRGKLKSVGTDSITITENDGSDVTIPVDEDTHIITSLRNTDAKLSDLEEGQSVIVHREEGKAARVVAVPPKLGDRPPIPPRGFGLLHHRNRELPAPPPLPDPSP
jgi:hypothetical protein